MALAPGLNVEPSNSLPDDSVTADSGAPNLGANLESGDFPSIYRLHFDFVWRSLRRLGVPESALDDAHQEVFLVAYRKLGQFRGRSTLKTWLFGIILNVVRHSRRASRRDAAHEPLAETVPDPQQRGPLESAAQSEAARMLNAFLQGLDSDKRVVFILAELEQMTAQEVATATSTNVRTVYSRLRAARQEFEDAVARHRARDAWRDHA